MIVNERGGRAEEKRIGRNTYIDLSSVMVSPSCITKGGGCEIYSINMVGRKGRIKLKINQGRETGM